MQSVPIEQRENSEPAPPSSQIPSFVHSPSSSHKSLHTFGGDGGGGGLGGGETGAGGAGIGGGGARGQATVRLQSEPIAYAEYEISCS